jgi:negative regulator of flagellin synthesis FlgM
MEVNGPTSVSGVFPNRPTREPLEVQPAAESKPVSPGDAVEISPAGKLLDTLSQSSELRGERLAQIKAAIEAGTYETPEKLEAALGKLLDEIGFDSDR